jgi:hypothetical protein
MKTAEVQPNIFLPKQIISLCTTCGKCGVSAIVRAISHLQRNRADRPPKCLLAGGRLCVVYDALLGARTMRRVRL